MDQDCSLQRSTAVTLGTVWLVIPPESVKLMESGLDLQVVNVWNKLKSKINALSILVVILVD